MSNKNLEKITSITIDNADHVHEFGGEFTPMRWVPIHMNDNPVTIEGNNREVIEVGGEFGGFKENFNVHGKSVRLINLYASNIIYIGQNVNRS